MAKKKDWKEAELIQTFHLERIATHQTPLMMEWLTVKHPKFTNSESEIFEKIYQKAVEKLEVGVKKTLK